jgi:hypothetical protein
MYMKILKLSFILPVVGTMTLLSGCATTGKSIAAGGLIGAGAGGIIGAIADPGANGQYRTRNIIIGSALGGVAGITAGALIGDGIEEKKKDAYEDGKKAGEKSNSSRRPEGSPPELKNPKVEARWIEAKSTGNRYVDGHWEYIISEPARFEEVQ